MSHLEVVIISSAMRHAVPVLLSGVQAHRGGGAFYPQFDYLKNMSVQVILFTNLPVLYSLPEIRNCGPQSCRKSMSVAQFVLPFAHPGFSSSSVCVFVSVLFFPSLQTL